MNKFEVGDHVKIKVKSMGDSINCGKQDITHPKGSVGKVVRVEELPAPQGRTHHVVVGRREDAICVTIDQTDGDILDKVPVLTGAQNRRLRKAVNALCSAKERLSWKGASDPECWDQIDEDHARATTAYYKLLQELTEMPG